MLLLSIDSARENMRTARAIYNAEGYMLLAKGVSLKDQYIERLKDLGVTSIYVTDNKIGEIAVEDTVTSTVKLEAIKATKEIMDNIKLNKKISGEKVSVVINTVMDELFLNRDVLFNLTDIRSMNDYTFAHNVSVAIYSIVTGIVMGYDYSKLKVLGLGAILHDVGKAKINEIILNKPGKLNPFEYAEVQRHCLIGFNTLRHCNEINKVSAHIAWQHHERFDGSGYPRKLKGTEIHEYARIVAIADVYDALSTDRVYRKRMIPKEIINYFKENMGKTYDPEIAEIFMQFISPYTYGSLVLLNTGERAIVMNVFKDSPESPKVKIITDKFGNMLKAFYEKDLRIDKTTFIIEQLKEN